MKLLPLALALMSCQRQASSPLPCGAGFAGLDDGPGRLDAGLAPAAQFPDLDSPGELVLGVFGPAEPGAAPDELGLRRRLVQMAGARVDALVVSADIASTPEGLARALATLAEISRPVLVQVGQRWCAADYAAALARVRDNERVVDLSRVRTVRFPGATLVSLPGSEGAPECGCRAAPAAAQELGRELGRLAAAGIVPVLVSPGVPRGIGPASLDEVGTDRHPGDPGLAAAIGQAPLRFGVFFGSSRPAPRATGDLEGRAAGPSRQYLSAVFLAPGLAGHQPLDMDDGTVTTGHAALLTVRDGKAIWQPLPFRGRPEVNR